MGLLISIINDLALGPWLLNAYRRFAVVVYLTFTICNDIVVCNAWLVAYIWMMEIYWNCSLLMMGKFCVAVCLVSWCGRVLWILCVFYKVALINRRQWSKSARKHRYISIKQFKYITEAYGSNIHTANIYFCYIKLQVTIFAVYLQD